MKRHGLITLLFFLFFSIAAWAQESGYIKHIVTRGQTLFSIAKQYDTTVEIIVRYNPTSAKSLATGQELKIPRKRPNTVNNENNVAKRNGKLYHTIKSKETLFSLGKKYGVTPDEICAANPGLSIDNFPIGKEILIPQKGENTEDATSFRLNIRTDDKKPAIATTHKVKRRETIEKICKKYGITPEQFLSVNPQLEGREVKRKMIVNIPAKPDKKKKHDRKVLHKEEPVPVAEKKAEKEEHTRQDDGQTRIAVVLPFLLERFAPEEQGRMVEFYQGFLMAAEKLKNEKHSFEINTFDSGFKDKSLDSLINSGALDNMDIIIGAYYPNHNNQLGQFALEKKIPLVIPFSNKQDKLYRNPMVYFVNTLQSSIMNDVTNGFITTFPDANVIFVEDTIKGNKESFIKSMTAELARNNIPYSTIKMEDIEFEEEDEEEFLNSLKALATDSTRKNIIIPTSSSKETLNRILPPLVAANALDTTLMKQFHLFGYPEWQVYAQQTREQMYDVDTYFYATFYSHFSLPEAAKFQNDFIRWYNRDLQKIFPRYGILGYDIGYKFILGTILYGDRIAEKINEFDSAPIQTGFKFERINGEGGMMNKKLYFIHYKRDYNIEKIDLDKCKEL